MNEHLSDLWKIDPIQRQKSIKLLRKICNNILSDSSNKKYHDLNFLKIKKILNGCESAIALLFDIGFEISMNETRLKWKCNDVNLNLLFNLMHNIDQKAHLLSSRPREITSSTKDLHTEQSLQNRFVPDLNFNASLEDDSSKHLLQSSNIKINTDYDRLCNLSICWSLRRIVKILKQYHLYVKSKEKDNVAMELIEFGYDLDEIKAAIALSHQTRTEQKIDGGIYLEDIYGHNENKYNNVDLMNDFNHLLFKHSNDFEAIYNELRMMYNEKFCDLSKCHLLRRNRRDREKIRKHEHMLNILYFSDDIVSQQLLDAIHCFYLHSFDVGFRLTNKERSDIINKCIPLDDEKTINSSLCDSNVSQINSIIKSKQKQCLKIDALNNKTHKFKSVNLNHYSYGFKFYYWIHAQRIGLDKWEGKIYIDENDNAGAAETQLLSEKPSDFVSHQKCLYIPNKYQTFKQEITMNEIQNISKEQWDNLVKVANIHCASDYVKAMRCFRQTSAICYDMKYGDDMLIGHVIAMRLYTSNDALQQKFSETFRITNNNETLKDLVERHGNFYWFARRLRESVECFGINGPKIGKVNNIRLFHGIDTQFMFPSISPIINGPFSTSTDYCVATNFCAGRGMILELSINADLWNMDIINNTSGHTILPCMDMQWISEYPNEQELFCMGGLRPFVFDSIIEVATSSNYSTYIHGLKIALRGTETQKTQAETMYLTNNSKAHQQIAFRLLSDAIHRYFPDNQNAHQFKSCPDYIRTMMQTHCNNVLNVQITGGRESNIMDHFLIDNKTQCVNLELLTTIFPNVAGIQANDLTSYSTIIQNILDFISTRNQSVSLRSISITYDPKYYEEISCCLEKVKDIFEMYSWSIYTRTISVPINIQRMLYQFRTALTYQFGSMEKAMQTEKFKQLVSILVNMGVPEIRVQNMLSDGVGDKNMICITKK